MSVQFEKFKSFPSTRQKNLRVFPSIRLKMYRGRRLEGSGKIHLNSIFSVLNCLKEGYNDSPSFFHTIIHFNSVLKNTVLNFPAVTMNTPTWMTWNSPFFSLLIKGLQYCFGQYNYFRNRTSGSQNGTCCYCLSIHQPQIKCFKSLLY